MKKTIITILGVLVLITLSCTTAPKAWEKAREKGTIEAYKDFIEKYPKSEYIQEAKSTVEWIEWGKTLQVNTLKSFKTFIEKYPQGQFRKEAESIIEWLGLNWVIMVGSNEIQNSSNVDEMWTAIQQMDKSVSNSRTLIISCDQFIKTFSSDKRAEEAQQIIDSISTTLQIVPFLIRAEGIPLANGCALNLAGAPINSSGQCDLRKGGRGLMSPHKVELRVKTDILQQRAQGITKIIIGMTLTDVSKLLGDRDDVFEQADGKNYQQIHFYELPDKKRAMLWSNWFDRISLVCIGTPAKEKTTESINDTKP